MQQKQQQQVASCRPKNDLLIAARCAHVSNIRHTLARFDREHSLYSYAVSIIELLRKLTRVFTICLFDTRNQVEGLSCRKLTQYNGFQVPRETPTPFLSFFQVHLCHTHTIVMNFSSLCPCSCFCLLPSFLSPTDTLIRGNHLISGSTPAS